MGNQVCVYHLEEVLAAVLVLVHTYTRGWDGMGRKISDFFGHVEAMTVILLKVNI